MESDQNSPIPQTKAIKSADHSEYMLKRLEKFYVNEEFFDITLIAASDNTQVRAHRGVLAVASEFFLRMFSSDFKESKSKEIELEDISGVVLRLIINFVYTGSIEVSTELVQEIVKAAHFYQINSLVDVCCDFMEEQLNLGNCIHFYAMAEQYGWTKLQNKAIGLISKNFPSVTNDREFLRLNPDQLCMLIDSDEFNVQSEEEVFLSIAEWLKHDEVSRMHSMLSILKNIRFSSLTIKFISDKRRLVCKTDECKELLWNWMEWHLSPEKRSEIEGLNTKSRKSICQMQKLIAFSSLRNVLYTYDGHTNIWSEKELRLQSEIENFALASANDKLYITGGRRRSEVLNTVICIDLKTYEVTNLPPMKRTRYMHSSVCLNGALYVCGGFAEGPNCIERYDFSNRTWQVIATLHTTDIMQIAILNNDIYIIGPEEMYSYNTTTGLLSEKPCTTLGTIDFVFCAVNGYLYAVGNAYIKNIERYDPTAQSWSSIPSPPNTGLINCISYNNRLCVIRRNNANNIMISADEYYPETNEWKTSAIAQLRGSYDYILMVEQHE